MTFSDPASSTGINYSDLKGSLLLFDVLGVEPHIPTAYSQPGQSNPAVRANVSVLDGASAGLIAEDTLVFPKVLQGQLKSRVGQQVLGRLSQGQAKPGQSAPWLLQAANAADKARAEEWVTTRGQSEPASAEAPF